MAPAFTASSKVKNPIRRRRETEDVVKLITNVQLVLDIKKNLIVAPKIPKTGTNRSKFLLHYQANKGRKKVMSLLTMVTLTDARFTIQVQRENNIIAYDIVVKNANLRSFVVGKTT